MRTSAFVNHSCDMPSLLTPSSLKCNCCPRVLTMERIFGAPLIDLEAISKVSFANPERVLISALNTWFGSVLQAETFHADVHAGETGGEIYP